MSDYMFEGKLRSPDEIMAIATYRGDRVSLSRRRIAELEARIASLREALTQLRGKEH